MLLVTYGLHGKVCVSIR